MKNSQTIAPDSIAIVGMSGRFPGARSVAEFWENQKAGREGIRHFGDAELEVPGPAPADPNFVKARGILEDVDLFDAAFFGILPKEAELIDPQQRLFLECCWEALEDAGYDPFAYPGAVAVYAGATASTYFLNNVCGSRQFLEDYTAGYQIGGYPYMMGANPDFIATRVSYKLNLRGPAFTMQAGCSTSLLAVCQACQSLLTYQSDMALAGGVSITFPQRRGYWYQEGGMGSPDGHCRAFDEQAAGTVFGSGAAVVLLKRLEDAIAEGDHIYAVIRGFAMNNDGSSKVGYTAPSVEGQAKVIALAHAAAGVEPESIGYIEAHGTGTPLGDPIEVAGLTQAFRAHTEARNFCALGTAKANVGHLDNAAGVTGLIHAAQMLRHKTLVPTLHFCRPNPKLELEQSPFYVNTKLRPWETKQGPRRAGVSAFGVGGTNAHVILEEAPETESAASQKPSHLLLLSAKSDTALEAATRKLAAHLKENPALNLADVAYTLQQGRRHFSCRRAVVAATAEDAAAALAAQDARRVVTRMRQFQKPAVVFLFPGQGSQYPNMGIGLYRSEPLFREQVDRCAAILRAPLGFDLRELIYPAAISPAAAEKLTQTGAAQPAIFTLEYALAKLWMEWGVRPQAMIGHSIGEFVAACLAGVFSLEDALTLVAKRGRLMQDLPAGAMLSVRLPEADIRPRLHSGLSLAASNGPALCVVAGPFDEIGRLEKELEQQGVMFRRLVTSHAFHSPMMDPIVAPFTEEVRKVQLHAPQMRYVSTVSGTWITREEATDPAYWGSHLRHPVLFAKSVAGLDSTAEQVLLEVGAGNALGTLARQHPKDTNERVVVSSLPDASQGQTDSSTLLTAAGTLWAAGVQVDWTKLYAGESRRRVSLPTYAFDRKRYWTEAVRGAGRMKGDLPELGRTGESPREDDNKTVVGYRVMESPTTTGATQDRPTRLRAALAEIFEELSGTDMASVDPSTTFLDLGFDSLFLTQVTGAIHAKFGLKITFRQLLDQESTLQALAAFLDSKLAADAFPGETAAPALQTSVPATTETPAAAPVSPAAISPGFAAGQPVAPADGNAVERIVREQLQTMTQLMEKQLQMLRGAAPGNAPAPVAAAKAPTQMPSSQNVVPSPEAAAKPEFKAFGPYKPVQKGNTGDLTPQQEKHIAGLIERYTRRTAGSKRLTQQHRKALADPRVVSGFRAQWKEMVYPIVTVRSKGSRLWDVDGNEYIDILNGFGPIMLGHRPDFVEKAVEQQLHEGFEIGPQTPLAGEVAELFCQMTGNERMTFCNTGSEAVMAALRVARTVTGRKKVVLFAGAYHGMFDEVLVKGLKTKNGPRSSPIAPGIPQEKVENLVVLDYGTPESLAYIREHAGELAAVLVEPVQSRHPALQPVEFLKQIRQITQDSGAALIFDEVVTGFRIHPGGCQALFDIRADLATYGKVVAGGMPIGVLAGKAAFMDALDGGAWQFGDDSAPEVGVTFFAGTFVRHPLTLAAVKAVLQHFQQEGTGLQEKLNGKTDAMVRRLGQFFAESEVPMHMENFGSIFYFSFPAEQRFGSLFYYHMREKGIHVQEGFPCFLTTTHSDADVERIVQAFQESVREMQQDGLLPGRISTAQVIIPKEKLNGHGAVALLADAADAKPELREAPLTESQLEIFLSAQLDKEASCSYNESISLRLRGSLDEPALRYALQQLLDRHQALRASFSASGEVQRFASSLTVELPVVDLADLQDSERQERVAQILAEDARRPFDLLTGPLVRTQLLKLGPADHLLLFTTHHIVCDGWSTNVLLDELSRLYSARHEGTNSNLPAPMQFETYARAQAKHFESAEGKAIEDYWVAQFQQRPPLLDLPLDRPRPAIKSFDGATHRRQIPADAYRAIKKAGAQQKCTLFVTLLAGFQVLLSRLTGQDEIVVGIPAAGQSLLEDEVLVGHGVNFLPLRGQLRTDATMAQYLTDVKRTLLDAYEHQNYTYGRLVRKLSIPRDPSRLPLVEVQFNLERVGADMKFSGLEVAVDPNPKAFVNHDLFLNIVESDDGLVLDCDYNTRLFDRETIDRWLGHYITLLEGFAADAQQLISRLPLLNDAERRQLTVAWNDTGAEYPRERCVQQLFEEQAARTPQNVAVLYEDRQLTYAELNQRANQLASYLIKLGVRPGVRVGIFVERSLEMIVALLGTLKAGGAYVPMDPTFPPERLRFILQDAKAPVVLTQKPLTKAWTFGDARVVHLDADWETIAREGASNPPAPDTDSLAYVIYTSGSTGKPKGVEISHRALTNLLWAMREEPGVTKDDTLAAVTTLSFDIAGLELYVPLCVGARLVIISRETGSYGVQLLDQLKKVRASVMQATPVTWKLLMDAGWEGNPALKAMCGGEAFPRELANELVKRCSSVWNMYGPTETTIWSAVAKVETGEGPVTIGKPIANTQFYVLDPQRQLVPIGVAGELYIAGDGLARGYWSRPELTAEKFVADPFRQEPGARMYRTGDLVRRRTDGSLEFLGRLDEQIKLRGFRIELGEIQSVLKAHANVADAVVTLREDVPGDKRLVAYLVAASGNAPTPAELRTFLLTRIPDYMVPAIFVSLDALPLTPNGKIDRRALPVPDWSKPSRAASYAAPRNAEEETMAGIWAEVLRLEKVGINDNLFELGADSLHVFQIAARASKAGIGVTPRQILQHRTIAAIFAELAKTTSIKIQTPAITPVARQKYRISRELLREAEIKG